MRGSKFRQSMWALGTVLLLVIAAIGWAFVEPRLMFVDRVTVSSPEVPPGFDGARLVFATDIHAGSLLGEKRVDRIVNAILAENPDAILLGGDYVGGGDGGKPMFTTAAPRLRARLGTVAVLGNHDTGPELEHARSELESAGIVLLGNEHLRLRRGGSTIVIAGVEDKLTGRPSVAKAAQDVAPAAFAILLSHNPDVLPSGLRQAPKAFDLALAGHTHGGQITLFGLYAPYLPSEYGQRFRGGWSEVDGIPTLVSRGSGVFILPMRFFAPPQIHVITLKRGPKAIER